MITLKIDGPPVPWQVSRITKFASYNPIKKQKGWAAIQVQAQYKGLEIRGPVSVDYEFYMPIPASTSKVRQEAMSNGQISHTSKPDLDNLRKFYSDVLEEAGIIHNDSQIISGASAKFYSKTPHVKIFIHVLRDTYKTLKS